MGRRSLRGYYKVDRDPAFETDGWFDTGDVATLDPFGYMQITDRAKDVIKSGGEWISSIDLENLAVGHPKVAEAAVIGVSHPKWDERPLLVIVLKKGESASKEEILGFMQGKIAKWWMPDDVVFVDEIPHTATGKIRNCVEGSSSRTIGCRPRRRPSEAARRDDSCLALPRGGVDHLRKRDADAAVTLGRFVETVPSDQTADASIDSAFHQRKSWKLANVLFARHIGNDFSIRTWRLVSSTSGAYCKSTRTTSALAALSRFTASVRISLALSAMPRQTASLLPVARPPDPACDAGHRLQGGKCCPGCSP